MEEYSSTVNGSSCSYANLSNYNNSSKGMNVPKRNAETEGYYVVPVYGASGYGALQHDAASSSCSGYFSVDDAYKTKDGNCNQKYVRSVCQ